jgi:hypothetical protein
MLAVAQKRMGKLTISSLQIGHKSFVLAAATADGPPFCKDTTELRSWLPQVVERSPEEKLSNPLSPPKPSSQLERPNLKFADAPEGREAPNPSHCPEPSRLPAFDQTWREYISCGASELCQLEGVASSLFKVHGCSPEAPVKARRIKRAV